MEQLNIGWVGLGNMGVPMAQRLLSAGYSLAVYNRTSSKENKLTGAGATAADTPAVALERSDIVFIMISDDDAVRDVFNAPEGLLSAAAPEKIVVNMSTVSPGISREMSEQCALCGMHYIDAPVSGSVRQAEEGQLVIMAGGDVNAFEKVRPVLKKMGKLVMHLGGVGAGNSAKLAMNTLLGIYALGLSEAIVFANAQGIRTEDFVALMEQSALGNVFSRIKGEAIAKGDYRALFALKHIVKDLGLARQEGLDSTLGNAATETYRQAATDHSEEDIISIFKYINKNN